MNTKKKTNRKVQYFVFFVALVFWIVLLTTIQGDVQYWSEFWWMFPVAFIIALTVNTLGISGAALFVPFFILLFPLFSDPLTPVQSVKVGLIVESFGLSSSALAYIVFGLVDKKLALYAVLGATPFVLSGAVLTSYLPQSVLFIMIAGLLIVSILLILFKEKIQKKRLDSFGKDTVDYRVDYGEPVTITSVDQKTYSYCRTNDGYRKRFFGYGIGGFFQGAAGFGIGELGIISLILSNIPTRIALGTSPVVVASTAIIASSVHAFLSPTGVDSIPWNLVFVTVPAVIIGGQLAPYVASKLPSKLLEQFIGILFSVIAISLIILAIKS